MVNEALKIPKKRKEVMLWVHPAGPVVGSIFLFHQSDTPYGHEDPIEVLNHPQPFLVLERDGEDEVFFFNKRSIVRVEYSDRTPPDPSITMRLRCRLHMMDGAITEGVIKEALPPQNSRLFDYLNIVDADFIKLHVDEHYRCLVNKSYVVRVIPLADTEMPAG